MRTREHWQWEYEFAEFTENFCRPGLVFSLSLFDTCILLADLAKMTNYSGLINFVNNYSSNAGIASLVPLYLSSLGVMVSKGYKKYTKRKLEESVKSIH